jgi:hypothetical protein
VEFDMLAGPERSFSGLVFHGRDQDNYENFFIRPHQSGNPDANQYTPVFNGISGWQIYAGEGFSAPTRYRFGQWMHVRVDVYRDSALVSIDGAPVVHIPDLKRDERNGYLGFRNSLADTFYSNVRIARIPNYVDPAPPPPPPPLPAGTILHWRVSEALGEEDALRRAAAQDWAGIGWTGLAAETNGIANLARVARRSEDHLSTIARFSLQANAQAGVSLDFGFSDAVTVFVNGQRLYSGNDSYRSRDYRFLGTAGLFDRLYLPLHAGRNEIAFVVTEGSGGGWAATARLDPAHASLLTVSN